MSQANTTELAPLAPYCNYNTIQVIMDSTAGESPVDYFHKVYKYFKLGYEPCAVNNDKNEKPNGRIVISVNRKRFNTEHKFAYILNGFIVEYVNKLTDNVSKNQIGKILAVPVPLLLTQNRQQASVNKLINTYPGKFSVYPVMDGTGINLYYYDSRWCIATVNSFEINTLKWLNDITYEQALCETLKVEKFSDFTDNLNTDYCYVLGFHHKQIHPLDSEFDTVWSLRAYNTKRLTTDVLALQSSGSPIDAYAGINLDDYIVDCEIPGVVKVEPMVDYDMVTLLRNNEAALSKFIKQSQICYGFIVRGDVNELGEHSNMLFESSLLTAMRNYLYNFPKDRELKKLSSVDKIKYQALKAYLDQRNRETFKTLFPSIANAYYSEFHHLLYEITNRILSMFRSRPAWASAAEHAHENWFNLTSYLLAKRIAQASKIQPFSAEAIKIINDMVCSHHYTTYLLRALLKEQVDESDRNFNKHKVKKPKYDKTAVRKFLKEDSRAAGGHKERNARHPTNRTGATGGRFNANERNNTPDSRTGYNSTDTRNLRERINNMRERIGNHTNSNTEQSTRDNTQTIPQRDRQAHADNFNWRRQPTTDQSIQATPRVNNETYQHQQQPAYNARSRRYSRGANDSNQRGEQRPYQRSEQRNHPTDSQTNDNWNEVRRGRNKEKYNRNKAPKEGF